MTEGAPKYTWRWVFSRTKRHDFLPAAEKVLISTGIFASPLPPPGLRACAELRIVLKASPHVGGAVLILAGWASLRRYHLQGDPVLAEVKGAESSGAQAPPGLSREQ